MGTGVIANYESVKRRHYFYVCMINKNTSESQLKKYVVDSLKAKESEVDVHTLHESIHSKSFRITLPSEFDAKALDTEGSYWPTGAEVRRFFWPRNSPTSNINRSTHGGSSNTNDYVRHTYSKNSVN